MDVLAITKADADPAAAARARGEYEAALHLMRARHQGWSVPVLLCSALTGAGIAGLWDAVMEHRAARERDGSFLAERARQQVYWMWQAIEAGLLARFVGDARVAGRRAALEEAVRRGEMSPDHAAAELLGLV